MMNIINIAGGLGRDAEFRTTPKGDSVLSFSVADKQFGDRGTIWWNCGLFGKRAESLREYLKKGQNVTVAGQVTQRQYKDKEGQEKTATEVRVIEIALQGKPPVQEAPKPANRGSFEDMSDDVPF